MSQLQAFEDDGAAIATIAGGCEFEAIVSAENQPAAGRAHRPQPGDYHAVVEQLQLQLLHYYPKGGQRSTLETHDLNERKTKSNVVAKPCAFPRL